MGSSATIDTHDPYAIAAWVMLGLFAVAVACAVFSRLARELVCLPITAGRWLCGGVWSLLRGKTNDPPPPRLGRLLESQDMGGLPMHVCD